VTRARAPLAPGSAIAPGYEVIEHLNRARTLDVYDVWSDERECRCIAKTLRPDRAGDRSARRRLEQEGRLLRRLSHPHIVRAYESLAAPRPVVIMETLSGETLAHLIEEGDRRLAPVEIAQLGLQLCSAIQYLHRHGFLHLDLKPSNIVAEAGRAKIIDLSVARRPGGARGGIGTWCYMAPEQVTGGELGAAADVWGIGVVLWEAAAGQPAFGGDEEEERLPSSSESGLPAELHPQLQRAAEQVRRHRRLPATLARAIDAALSPEPSSRPSVSELAERLAQVPGVVSPKSPSPRVTGGA
jgi:eukaryotic-like serine/threonine-protein kinase